MNRNGESNTKLYKRWKQMIYRCHEPKSDRFKNYGAKGIKVFIQWHDYEKFKSWAISNGYSDDLELERLNNNEDYHPDNCVYVNRRQQCHNMCTNNEFVGVLYDSHNKGYKASLWINGKNVSRFYSINKYGKDKAYQLAKAKRLELENEYQIKVVRG